MSYELNFVLEAPTPTPLPPPLKKIEKPSTPVKVSVLPKTNPLPAPVVRSQEVKSQTSLVNQAKSRASLVETQIRSSIKPQTSLVSQDKSQIKSRVATLLSMKPKIPSVSSPSSSGPTYILKFNTEIVSTGYITKFITDTIPITHSVYGYVSFDPIYKVTLTPDTPTSYSASITYCRSCRKKTITQTFLPVAGSDTSVELLFTLPCNSGKEEVTLIITQT